MKPTFIVCEDGTEYVDRFERFLGGDFAFVRAAGLGELLTALGAHQRAAGLVLDLDFRRTPPAALVDDAGAPLLEPSAGEQARVAAVQGILILRALRSRGVQLPALLCTDIDDPAQLQHVVQELAPLEVVPSTESLPRLKARLTNLAERAIQANDSELRAKARS